MKINYLLSIAALLLTIGVADSLAQPIMRGPAPLDSGKIDYQCLETNAQGTCVRERYYENGYWVETCTAPADGKCTATMHIGNKKAVCNVKDGEMCSAKVKAPR